MIETRNEAYYMAKPPVARQSNTFRFELEFVDLLNTWSFVSKKEKTQILVEAFIAYTKSKQNKETAQKVEMILDSLKED